MHAIYGFDDLVNPDTGNPTFSAPGSNDFNNPNFDHIGRTQAVANQILQEAGYPFGYWQVGYDAVWDVSPSTFRTDISYTEGNAIDIAYFDTASNKTPDVLDLSLRTDSSKDLIIGLGGNDRINGGAGRDYLYGGVGDDTLSGGSGDDVLHGGDRKTAIASDGVDTADYSIGDRQLAPSHGVTVNISAGAATGADKMDGLTPIVVSDDGYGDRDRLFSIENIKLTGARQHRDGGSDLHPRRRVDLGDRRRDPAEQPDRQQISRRYHGIVGGCRDGGQPQGIWRRHRSGDVA